MGPGVHLTGILALITLCGACGGDGVDAPYSTSGEHCPELDDYLAPVLTLAEEDGLSTIRIVMAEDLSDDDRHDLVELMIELIGAFDLDGLEDLNELGLDDDQISDLELTVGTVARWVATDGPGAPYTSSMAFAVTALNTCDGPPLFFLVQELLNEQALVEALMAAIQDPQLDVQGILDGLDSPDGDPRSGLRALIRNLLVAATKPDFDVREWTGLLGLLLDVDSPPWSEAISGLETFLVPGPRLDAAQSIVGCVLAVDAELVWVDLVYDLLTTPPELVCSPAIVSTDGASGALIPSSLQQPLTVVLDIFHEDPSARQTLVRLSSALLAPERSQGVLSDVATLAEAGAVIGLIEGLVAAVTKACAP